MLAVSSREYKVMLDQRMFAKPDIAATAFHSDLRAVASRTGVAKLKGSFNKSKRREITFLDTPDLTIALNRLIFRRRDDLDKPKTEYTLKCRSPDRYVAAGARVDAASRRDAEGKFEEDIGAPFVVRFSHSETVEHDGPAPATLADAAELFPVLNKLKRDGQRCAGRTELVPVNAVAAYERVLTGPKFVMNDVPAEIALILWSDGRKGRPLVAEFSFRYGHDEEEYSDRTASIAMKLFEAIQRLDWCVPDARTKTQFIYSEG